MLQHKKESNIPKTPLPEGQAGVNAVVSHIHEGGWGGRLIVREGVMAIPLNDELSPIPTPEQDSEILPVGVLKQNANDGNQGVIDSLTLDADELSVKRMIKQFAGKKDKQLMSALEKAIEYIAEHPMGDGSEKVQGLKNSEPTFNLQRVSLWRFKPRQAQGFKAGLSKMNGVRIVYGLVDTPATGQIVGILDIVDRDHLGKKYN